MTDVSRAVDKATDSAAFERMARGGHAMSGFVHLLIAYIVVRLAFGGSGSADQSGALGTLAAQTGGAVLLWICAAFFVAMGLWRLAETVIGPHPSETRSSDDVSSIDRAKALGLAVVYFSFAYSAGRFARGTGTSSGDQNVSLATRMMATNGGTAVLVAVGLIVIAVGGYHVHKGVSRSFLDDLTRSGGSVVVPLGIVGYTAKGLVLMGAGLLVIVATLRSDPSRTAGVDAAVKTLGAAPFGQFLLVLAGLGVAAYGLYGFAMARYARM